MTTALTPEQRIAALEAELAKLAESECDKIMAMSDEQITALTRMQGSNPDDVAKLGRMTFDLALKDVALQRLEAELAACKRDAERWQEVLRRVSANRHHVNGGVYVRYHMRFPDNAGEHLMRGSVAGHFTKGIDAAIAAQKQK